jgi:hypothetical protein
VRLSHCELRDHMLPQTRSLALVSILQALQRRKRPMRYNCEIFGAAIFEFFNTICQKRTSPRSVRSSVGRSVFAAVLAEL